MFGFPMIEIHHLPFSSTYTVIVKVGVNNVTFFVLLQR